MLGGAAGAAIALLVGVRVAAAERLFQAAQRQKQKAAGLFIGLFTAAALLTWEGWFTLLPWLASCVATGAYFLLQGDRLRWAFITSCLLWVVYGLQIGSIGAVLTNGVGIAAGLSAIARLRRDLASRSSGGVS